MSASSLAVEPAHRNVPEHHRTFGPEVVDLASMAGFPPDAEQAMVLDALFAVDKNGLSTAFETAVIACRQNLKTGVFKQAALGWLFITDEQLVVWSAHEWNTIKDAFRDLHVLVTGSDVLRRRVKRVYTGNGDESIELTSGARLIFRTRTRGGGRGLSGQKVVLDEGFALQPMHMGALLPTLSAQPDPQVVYGSSAGLVDSEVLRGIRDRGRKGGEKRLAYFEWCAPDPSKSCELGDKCTHALDTPGCGCDKPELWQRANPAMGRRISVENIEAERRAMPPEEFGRERMGWWDDPQDGSPFPLGKWADLADETSRPDDNVVFAFEVAFDRSSSSITVYSEPDLGHVELIDKRAGTDWVVGRIVELRAKWNPIAVAVDGKGPALSLIQDLEQAGVIQSEDPEKPKRGDLVVLALHEMAAAYAQTLDAVFEGTFRHLDDPELNAAVENAIARPVGDVEVLGRRKASGDVSPLSAFMAARWAYRERAGLVDADAPPNIW